MRDIKFRAWNCFTERWYEECFFISRYGCKFNCNDEYSYIEEYEPINPVMGLKVQQYTGLNDKNGKEIFEGDFVKYHFDDPKAFFIDLVAWEHYGWRLLHYDGIESGSSLFTPLPSMEIIGNIFENKELLK